MFTSDVDLCLIVGGTVVRRGERPLIIHLGEITMPSRGRGCLKPTFRTPDYISSGRGGFQTWKMIAGRSIYLKCVWLITHVLIPPQVKLLSS